MHDIVNTIIIKPALNVLVNVRVSLPEVAVTVILYDPALLLRKENVAEPDVPEVTLTAKNINQTSLMDSTSLFTINRRLSREFTSC